MLYSANTNPMHNIIYLSSASYLFPYEDLDDILTKSRINNSRLDITGLLLYHEGSILQILEGEQQVLQSLYKKIERDTRHKGIITMIDVPISERSFGDWSMGFKQVSNDNWEQLEGSLNLNSKDDMTQLMSSGSSSVISLIKSFANVNKLNAPIY